MIHAVVALLCLVAQDQVFASRSGARKLEVNVYGDEEFRWILRGPEGVEWERTVRHSAEKAYVCEDGSVIACGETSAESWRERFLALTILGPNRDRDATEEVRLNGELRSLELHPPMSRISHAGSFPKAREVLAWESEDLCAFWIADVGRPDQLWVYSISKGVRERVIDPGRVIADASEAKADDLFPREIMAPGGNDLFVATLILYGEPSPGTYVRANLCGIVALIRVDGQLLWARRLPDDQFPGPVQVIESNADDLRCSINANRETRSRAPGRRVDLALVETLELHFQREGDAWILR